MHISPASVDVSQSYKYEFAPGRPFEADVLFADGRHFHHLDLSSGRDSSIFHNCPPDSYSGHFEHVTTDGRLETLAIVWTVSGPSKNYVSRTTLEKESVVLDAVAYLAAMSTVNSAAVSNADSGGIVARQVCAALLAAHSTGELHAAIRASEALSTNTQPLHPSTPSCADCACRAARGSALPFAGKSGRVASADAADWWSAALGAGEAAAAAATLGASRDAGGSPVSTAATFVLAGSSGDALSTPPFLHDHSSLGSRISPAATPEVYSPAYAASAAACPVPIRSKHCYDRLGWGQFAEDRSIYDSFSIFSGGSSSSSSSSSSSESGLPTTAAEPRTVHLGVDLEAPAGTPVHTPLRATVHSVADNSAPGDYGPTVILQHSLVVPTPQEPETGCMSASDPTGLGSASPRSQDATCAAPSGTSSGFDVRGSNYSASRDYSRRAQSSGAADFHVLTFYTLWGHLSRESVSQLRVGGLLPAGAVLGRVGLPNENGGWPPHVHVQLILEPGLGGRSGDYPGVCASSERRHWLRLCPDPAWLLGSRHVIPVVPT
jgi:murein DD-endopeptidase MepM/ murein hydrolase activator NlpD